MVPFLSSSAATLYHARAEEVYPHLTPGSVSMVWSDGPYAMNKADWDRMGVDGLADWYTPHVEAWSRLCAPSATVYLWGTSEGWARIDPVIRAAGWTFRSLIVWDKGMAFLAGRIDTASLQTWPEVTEVCGMYQREVDEMALWNERGEAHPVRRYLDRSRLAAGLSLREVDAAIGTKDMARHWFTWSQWVLPSPDRYEQLRALLPGLDRPLEELRLEQERVRAEHVKLWSETRVPFNCPVGVSNAWSAPPVSGGARLLDHAGEAHPCQKPLAFAERAVRASTRVGDTILDPFAGTNRIALACRHLPEEDRRHAIGIEMDRRWLEAIRPALVAHHTRPAGAKQPSLFGTR